MIGGDSLDLSRISHHDASNPSAESPSVRRSQLRRPQIWWWPFLLSRFLSKGFPRSNCSMVSPVIFGKAHRTEARLLSKCHGAGFGRFGHCTREL